MKVLVTGAKGQLGYDVIKRLEALGDTPIGADIDDFDITDAEKTQGFIIGHKPQAVIHCAAYTAVDRAEDEPEKCRLINVEGTRNIANACRLNGSRLVYISSDYVFGDDGCSLLETDSPKNPQSVYGITKLEGEAAAMLCPRSFIVRTSWVFGENGGNFVKTMLRLSETHDSITVVNDQTGSPTYTPDLARLLCDMIKTDKFGVYHASNEGFCTWAEFAGEIMRLANRSTRIIPCTSEEYAVKAKRPKNSRLSKTSLDKAGFERLPDWHDALERFLKNLDL